MGPPGRPENVPAGDRPTRSRQGTGPDGGRPTDQQQADQTAPEKAPEQTDEDEADPLPSPEQPADERGGYEMVLRYRAIEVEDAASDASSRSADLRSAVVEALGPEPLRPPLGGAASIALRVLQPVIGSAPVVWELRITAPRLSQLGEVLDQMSEPRQERSILGRLTHLPGFTVIEEGAPLFRSWRIV